MISVAQQQLDEVLTAGGHSDQCPAFEGRRCPGFPMCGGNPVPDELYAAVGADRETEARKQPRVVTEVSPIRAELRPDSGRALRGAPLDAVIDVTGDGREAAIRREVEQQLPGAVVLTGTRAAALVEYEAAAKELKAADEMHRQAVERFQRAHQAFADAMAAR